VKTFVLAAKITLFFSLVTGLLLGGALLLFMRVAGHEMLDELGLLRTHQGVLIATEIEALLEDEEFNSAAVHQRLRGEERNRGLELRIERGPAALGEPPRLPRSHHFHQNRSVTIAGRKCYLVGAPRLESWVPLRREGKRVAYLVVQGPLHLESTRRAFLVGLLQIGAVALVCVLALAFYLTTPLQRMKRSMDRIAAGDLEHRVAARGLDEVAAMGRSFNTMAERINTMVTGQKELMAGVSHELRSPLARMKLQLELLRGELGAAKKEGKDRTQQIEAEVDTLNDLVGELLLASRFDLDAVPLAPERLELCDLVEQSWQRVADTAAKRKITLECTPDPDATQLVADPTLTVRILGNLFENAVRYAREGAIRVTAIRVPGADTDRVEITVADQGPGVPAEQLGRLFEPFFRADPSRSRKTGANGLGLMIVRRAVEAHGGKVRAELRSPRGLAVRFDLAAE